MQSPTETDDGETYWLRSRDVSDSERIGGDEYFSEHGVTRPDAVTADDLPPTDDEAVREIDREALEREQFVGKWQVTGSADGPRNSGPNCSPTRKRGPCGQRKR